MKHSSSNLLGIYPNIEDQLWKPVSSKVKMFLCVKILTFHNCLGKVFLSMLRSCLKWNAFTITCVGLNSTVPIEPSRFLFAEEEFLSAFVLEIIWENRSGCETGS